jgi:hypothetical protein
VAETIITTPEPCVNSESSDNDSLIQGNPYRSFTFPPIGEEPFNLDPYELKRVWGGELPSSEKATTDIFTEVIGRTFKLLPQVRLRHYTGVGMRIDFIGLDRTRAVAEPIGFEMKTGDLGDRDFRKFTHSIRQSIDYAKSTIEDSRCAVWSGKPLRFVFQFPCPYQVYENDNRMWRLDQRDLWAQGVLKLATESAVGAMCYVPRRRDWGMFLGGHPAWWVKGGPTHLAKIHSRAKNVGSAA